MRIKVLREKLNLSQSEFALQIGVSQSCVAKWENGSNFPLTDKLVKIATVLGCTVDELLKEENKNEKQKDLRKS